MNADQCQCEERFLRLSALRDGRVFNLDRAELNTGVGGRDFSSLARRIISPERNNQSAFAMQSGHWMAGHTGWLSRKKPTSNESSTCTLNSA
jgi:hypothetical protein